MAQVVTINKETPVDFIRRNGPTLTSEVANRFCLSQKDALFLMKGLEELGHVRRRRVAYDIAAGYEWTANA